MPAKNSTSSNKTISDFISYLEETKGQDGVKSYIEELGQTTALATYTAIMFFLTDEDLSVLDKITDEAEAEKEIRSRFAKRAGISLDELADQIQTYYTELAQKEHQKV